MTQTEAAAPGQRRPRAFISTVDAVASSLRRRVLDGELPPGTHLREVTLSETYGVARHCVRAAVRKLVHEGLLTHQANRGAFVPAYTPAAIHDLHVLRRAIELEAVRVVCLSGLPVDRIAARVERLAALPLDAPWGQLVSRDLEIHEELVDLAGSKRASRAYRALTDELRLCLAFLSAMPARRGQLRSEHEQIVEALAAHETDRAVNTMRVHLDLAEHNIAAAVAAQAAPSSNP